MTSDYYIPEYGRIVASRPPSGGAPPELVARMQYAGLLWWERLVTCPPPGWRGGWTARLVSRYAGRRVVSVELVESVEPAEPVDSPDGVG